MPSPRAADLVAKKEKERKKEKQKKGGEEKKGEEKAARDRENDYYRFRRQCERARWRKRSAGAARRVP